MRGAIHHLDLSVTDPAASRPFYDAVLGFMGYRVSTEYDHGGYDFDLRRDGQLASVGLRPTCGPNASRAHDRYTSGLHHVAWTADSRADVDALYDVLKRIGAVILYPPAEYPEYSEGYYAVFFADPDGLKLEYCFVP